MSRQPLVLLVAMDGLTRRDVAVGLESYGHTVVTAASGEEALAIIGEQRNRVSVLVVDADMRGEVDGLAVATAARAAHPKVTVIYTARLPHTIPVARQVSGAPLVRTPYHPHQLAGVITMLRHDARLPGMAGLEAAA